MSEREVDALLRAALPPMANEAPARDLWPDVTARLAQAPQWSLVDLALAAGLVAALLLFRERLWLLAFHL